MDLLSEFFSSLGILSIIALIGAFFSARWRQPTVVGLLIIGAIAGPNMLGIIHGTEIVQLLAEFGATLLLFSIGVEFSISKVLGSGLRALFIASVILGALFFIGYECAVLLGLDYLPALVLGACLSFSSTALFVRLLSSHGLMQEPAVPMLISILVIEDIVAVGAMAFFSAIPAESIQADGAAAAASIVPHPTAILMSLLFSLALLGFAYLVLRSLLQHLRGVFLSIKSDENLVLMALGLCVVLSFTASAIGLSPAIGAFLAGSMVASFSIKEEVERIIHPFLLAFSSFFFISIGLMISPAALLQFGPAILFICVAFILSAFFVVGTVTYLCGFKLEQAILAGASMAALGEFSLLLAQSAAPLVKDIDLVSALSMVVLISTLASSLLLSRRHLLERWARSSFGTELQFKLGAARHYIDAVLGEFEGSGAFLSQAKSVFAILRGNLTLFVLIVLVMLLSRHFLAQHIIEWGGFSIDLPTAILLVALLFIAPALLQLARELRLLADAFRMVFVRTHSHAPDQEGRHMARTFQLVVMCALLLLVLPLVIDLLRLPNWAHLTVFIPLGALVLLLWDMLSHLAGLLSKRHPHHPEKGQG
jgi:CPA2 family monovalent cation:H+ antiporter-2